MIDRSTFRVSDTFTGSCFISNFLNNLLTDVWFRVKTVNHESDQGSNTSQGLWFVEDLWSQLTSKNGFRVASVLRCFVKFKCSILAVRSPDHLNFVEALQVDSSLGIIKFRFRFKTFSFVLFGKTSWKSSLISAIFKIFHQVWVLCCVRPRYD